MAKQMSSFRMHIRPGGGTAGMHSTFDYCIRNRILGVGWRIPSRRNTNTTQWDEYYKEAARFHENLSVCKYIKQRIAKDDLVWTRSPPPCQYYLARVLSGWEYWMSDEARRSDIDIANIIRCEIKQVEIDDVPGRVLNSFRMSKLIQAIGNVATQEYTKHLWNKISKTEFYAINTELFSDIFMMLSPEETEDLLFLYLQSLGWFMISSSRKADTATFEYLAVNPNTGERAITHIKTGNSSLNLDDYATLPQKVFLFQSNGIYSGDASNVICVHRSDLISFLRASRGWVPGVFDKKMEMIGM